MKKTAYLTPDILVIAMKPHELLAYSVNGEGLKVDSTVDNPNDDIDNRSRRYDAWAIEEEEDEEF